jgi:NADH-quinone oxidoreductase subunit C
MDAAAKGDASKPDPAIDAAMQTIESRLASKLPGKVRRWSQFRGQCRVVVAAADLYATLETLKRDHQYDQLTDVTAVDLLEYPDATDRFEIVYLLLNTESGQRLVVKTHLNEPDLDLPSVHPLWHGADWLEREVYDMYGVIFKGHPNFKRLLLPDAFTSFPMRKDYPVKGRGERHNFPVITRADS